MNIDLTNSSDISKLWQPLNLGELTDVPVYIQSGSSHFVFRLQVGSQIYALKVLRVEKAISQDYERFEQGELFSALVSHQVATVNALKINNKYVQTLGDIHYLVYPYLDHEVVDYYTDKHYSQLGHLLGKLHTSTKEDFALDLPKFNLLDVPDYDFYNYVELYPLTQEQIEKLNLIANRFKSSNVYVATLETVPSHCDIWVHDNILWKNQEPTLIDWESSKFVNPEFELLKLLSDFLCEPTVFDRAATEVFLSAYVQYRQLGDYDYEALLESICFFRVRVVAYFLSLCRYPEKAGVLLLELHQKVSAAIDKALMMNEQLPNLHEWLAPWFPVGPPESVATAITSQGLRVSGYVGDYIFERIAKERKLYEQHLLEQWYEPRGTSVIYDIGANIGNHTLYFVQNTPTGQVYAFEPVAANFSMLARNIANNNMSQCVSIFPYAAGSASGTVQLTANYVNNNGSYSVNHADNSTDASVSAPLVALDSLNLPVPNFIKIDTEGFELEVLKGLHDTLDKMLTGYVWIEVAQDTAGEVYDIMLQHGFYVKDMNLSVDNNILFYKDVDKSNTNRSNLLFTQLLEEANRKRILWSDRYDAMQSLTKKQAELQETASSLNSSILALSTEKEILQTERDSLQIQRDSLQIERDSLQIQNKDIQAENNTLQATLTTQQRRLAKQQTELDMFRNSRMIKTFRFVAWRIPKAIRWRVNAVKRKSILKVYTWLSRYPRLRTKLVHLNHRLGIIKHPHTLQQVATLSAGLPTQKKEIKIHPTKKTVAMIVDTFTYNSFKFECHALPVEPQNWKQIFEENKIDFFFCESAWVGANDQTRVWQGQIYKSVNFPYENRKVLLEILSYCKTNKIPTVFWNKEDPTLYGDKVLDFADTAAKFNHIFTTAEECIARYQQEYNHPSVHLLMFAAQPKLFNPIEKLARTYEIIFSGSWYNNFPERTEEMGKTFDKLLDAGYDLKIYNRQSNSQDPNYTWPDKYQPYLNPALSHDNLDQAYKGSHTALNFNTVTGSSTMFARRVFELMASNTLVLTNRSVGIERLFGNNVAYTDEPFDFSDAYNQRLSSLYTTLRNHTYADRFQTVLNVLDIQEEKNIPSVAIVYRSSPDISLTHFSQVEWSSKYGIIVLNDDTDPSVLNKTFIRYHNTHTQVTLEKDLHALLEQLQVQYVVDAGPSTAFSFVTDAMLHYSYLDSRLPIAYNETSEVPFTFQHLDTSLYAAIIYPIAYYRKSPEVYVILLESSSK